MEVTSKTSDADAPPKPEHAQTRALAKRIVLDWARPYWRQMVFALALMGVYALADGAIAFYLKQVLEMLSSGERGAIFTAPLIIMGLALANGGALYLQVRTLNGVALKIIEDLQKALFRHLTALDFGRIASESSGRLTARFTHDATLLRESLTRAPNNLIRDVLRLIVLAGVMAYLDWALFLAVLLIYPLAALPIAYAGRRARRISREAQAQLGDMTALLQESIAGARAVKTFQLESYEQARANAAFAERRGLMTRIIGNRAMVEPVVMMIGGAAVALVVMAAAWRMNTGALNLETFAAFITALVMLSQPARGLGTLNAVLQEGLAAAQRIFDILDESAKVVDRPDAAPLSASEGRIVFEDVRFSYTDENPALRGVSFIAAPGELTAIVGPSGSGKSTLFNLAPRLFDPESGRILIDDQPIDSVTLNSLRAKMAVVGQDPVMFDDTVRANIAIGRLDASTAEIEEAARLAAADGFIRALPKGYDTILGERGANLSGGERQRIALARALLKDAKILLLDEATSALDTASEARVQAALEATREGRTTLVIAHRLSTVQNADQILVLEGGRIVERGRHDALLAAGGLYARLCDTQFREGPASVTPLRGAE